MTELALAQHFEGVAGVAVQTEEDALVVRARNGDVGAFEEIMAHYEQRLLRFLVGHVGEAETARDLCQDTFFSAYNALPRTKGDVHLSAWLHTIALNKARSHHRKRKFRVFVSIDDHDVAQPGADMQEQIADHELVMRILAQLPKKYADPLLMQLGSGMSCREIAGVMKCSEGAIKVRLMRAREAFKSKYQEEISA